MLFGGLPVTTLVCVFCPFFSPPALAVLAPCLGFVFLSGSCIGLHGVIGLPDLLLVFLVGALDGLRIVSPCFLDPNRVYETWVSFIFK